MSSRHRHPPRHRTTPRNGDASAPDRSPGWDSSAATGADPEHAGRIAFYRQFLRRTFTVTAGCALALLLLAWITLA